MSHTPDDLVAEDSSACVPPTWSSGLLLAGDPVDALSMIVHRDKAYAAARAITERLCEKIPRQ